LAGTIGSAVGVEGLFFASLSFDFFNSGDFFLALPFLPNRLRSGTMMAFF